MDGRRRYPRRPRRPRYLNFNQPVQATAVKPFVQLTGTDAQKHANPVAVDVRPLTDDELKRVRDERWTNAQPTQLLAVVPAAALPLDTEYSLLLKAGLPGWKAIWAPRPTTRYRFPRTVPSTSSRSQTAPRSSPKTESNFRFSNPVKVVDLLKHTTFNPPVTVPKDLDVYESSELNVALNLKANTQYHFKMDGDLTDTYGQKISSPASGGASTPSTSASGSASRKVCGPWRRPNLHQIPVGLVDIHSLQVGLQAVTADTVVPLLHTLDSPPSAPAQALHEWSGAEHDDVVTWKNLNLEPALNGKQQGLVWVQLEDPTQSQNQRQHNTLVAVTNLGLTLKSSPENTSIGSPPCGRERRWREPRSSSRGSRRPSVARRSRQERAGPGPRVACPAACAARTTTSPPCMHWPPRATIWWSPSPAWSMPMPSTYPPIRPASYPNTECFLFTERGLYRAGEDVNFKGHVPGISATANGPSKPACRCT